MADVTSTLLEDLKLRLNPDGGDPLSGGDRFGISVDGFRQTVTVTATSADPAAGRSLRIVAETEVLREISADEAVVLDSLSDLNRRAHFSAYCFLPGERRVVATMVEWAQADTASWRAKVFSAGARAQMESVRRDFSELSARCGGNAVSPGAAGAVNTAKDSALASATLPEAAGGQSAIPASCAKELHDIAQAMCGSELLVSTAENGGSVALESPFDSHTALSELELGASRPALGPGMAVHLHLPLVIDSANARRISALLNHEERAGRAGTTHGGAWYSESGASATLAYSCFVPYGQYENGMIADVAISCVARMRWADGYFNARPPAGNLWRRLRDRRRRRAPR